MTTSTLYNLSRNIESIIKCNPRPVVLLAKVFQSLKEYKGIDWETYVSHTNTLIAHRNEVDDTLSVYTFNNIQQLPILHNQRFIYKVLKGCITEQNPNWNNTVRNINSIIGINNITLKNEKKDNHTVIIGVSSLIKI